MSIPRFYYQWNVETECWCVYDREFTAPQGDVLPIAHCEIKEWAKRIRDAMMIWNEVSLYG